MVRIAAPVQHYDISVARVDAVPPQRARAVRHSRLVLDAIRPAYRRRAIVARRDLAMEKGPKGRGVDVQVRAAGDGLRQAHAAGLVVARTPAEVRVAVAGQGRPWVGRVLQRAHTLPVGCFRLLHADVDILGLEQIVVVECVVLEGGACEPCTLGRLDQGTPSGGDILMATTFEGMVSCPAPHVVNVARAQLCQMKHGEGGKAGSRVGAITGAVDIRVGRATDSDVGVPDADIALSGACHVDLKNDCPRGDICDGEAHVLDLCNSGLSRITHHDHRLGVVAVTKVATKTYEAIRSVLSQSRSTKLTGDHWPSLSYNSASWRDVQGALYNIDAIWEVRDFSTRCVICQYGIQRSRVIGGAITFHTILCLEEY